MLQLFTPAIISFIVSFLAIPVIIQIADKKKLYDVPDERKLHTHHIASLGGIGIFLGFIFSSMLGINLAQNSEFQYFYAASFIIFFIGLKDDIVLLSATKKFVAQIIATAIIIHLGGIKIESLYGIFGINGIDQLYGIPLTYITIILVINAFNLIDGIDGLAGSLGLMATLLLGGYFYFAEMFSYAAFSFALSASLLTFLIFNYNPAKIFMGDCGSLLVGMTASILVLKFISVAGAANAVAPISSAVAMGISVIIIPIVDTLRVFAIRIFKGRSPFSPDRNHIHHLLIDRSLSHSAVTLICVLSNLILILGTYLLRPIGNTFLVVGLLAVCFIIMGFLYFTLPKRKMVIRRQYELNRANNLNRKQSKVINLNTKDNPPIEQVHI